MKNKFYLVGILFLISCKTTSLNVGFTGKWQSEDHYPYILELYNDRSFTYKYLRYVELDGGVTEVYHGTWTYLNAHTILLSFPCISDDVLLKIYDPLLTGKEVQVQAVDSKTMKIDSLAQNVVLKRFGQ